MKVRRIYFMVMPDKRFFFPERERFAHARDREISGKRLMRITIFLLLNKALKINYTNSSVLRPFLFSLSACVCCNDDLNRI